MTNNPDWIKQRDEIEARVATNYPPGSVDRNTDLRTLLARSREDEADFQRLQEAAEAWRELVLIGEAELTSRNQEIERLRKAKEEVWEQAAKIAEAFIDGGDVDAGFRAHSIAQAIRAARQSREDENHG